MIKCSGKSVLKGIAIGRIYLYKKQEYVLKQETVENPEAEVERLEKAKEAAGSQLEELYQKALVEAGEEQAMIFDVHKMMLEDEDYLDSIRGMIRDEKMNAEYAVSLTGDNFAGVFASMDDEYMKARSADVLDISKRLIRILAGVGEEGIVSEEPVILLADDLSPSETVQMDKSKILAIVTKHGSTNSHTAILARSMNIPALVQTDVALLEEYSGAKAVVDGFSGTFIINPEDSVLDTMVQKKMEYEKERTALQELKVKTTLPLTDAELTCMPISEMYQMWIRYWNPMPAESDFSAVNLFIWEEKIILQRKSSSIYIRKSFQRWKARR